VAARHWQDVIWRQYGAAIDTLEGAIHSCPDDLWQARLYHEPFDPRFGEYWSIAYHACFWLDYYLTPSPDEYTPPPPFTLAELDPDGVLPDRVYTRAELLGYLRHGRDKCRTRIYALSDSELLDPTAIRADWRDMSVAESMLYTMRHVQEHAAQLSLFLGQQETQGPGWVSRARDDSALPDLPRG
jgi:hypothetical protein